MAFNVRRTGGYKMLVFMFCRFDIYCCNSVITQVGYLRLSGEIIKISVLVDYFSIQLY